MKKYDGALALASTRDEGKLALARMILDMMEVDELYEPLKFDNGTFEDLKELDEARYFEILGIDYEEREEKLEEEFELKNYDVALALATAGKIAEARKAMEGVNPKKELAISNFERFEREELERALEIWETRDLHDRLFKWLKAKNLPQPELPREDKTYFREITVGWKKLGVRYRPGSLIEKGYFNRILRRELSRPRPYGYGALKPGLLKFVDYVAIIGDIAWIIEGKKKLNPESIRQIMEYYDLFIEDNPIFEVRKAIVCEEANLEHERTCRENKIEVFSLR
ncbi:MAG: hypothetical protein U9O85_07575 [Euryarchaeota archaeon]|nr:hypothetical protein [Euryarchaeota archaeon]